MNRAAENLDSAEERSELPLISELLGLITPESLDLLVSSTTAGNRIPLTEIIENRDKLDNLISLDLYRDKVGDTFNVGAVCELSVGEKCNLDDRPTDEESISNERDLDAESTSVFILTEKERLLESDRKIKKAHIITMYKKSSLYISKEKNENIEEEEEDDEVNKGVLINKKHY